MGGCFAKLGFNPSLKERLLEKKRRISSFFESDGELETDEEYASIIDSVIEFYDESEDFENDNKQTTTFYPPQIENDPRLVENNLIQNTFEDEESENREIERRFRNTFGRGFNSIIGGVYHRETSI